MTVDENAARQLVREAFDRALARRRRIVVVDVPRASRQEAQPRPDEVLTIDHAWYDEAAE